MRHGSRLLAVVPARGGSRGVPGKNLRVIAGRSLVGHAIAMARSLAWIDEVIVSTDDQLIAAESRRCGAEVPFLRPPELAGDSAGSVETWRHAWVTMETHLGATFEASVLLEPSSPLRTVEDVSRAVDAVLLGGHETALTVSRTPAHYTPHKSLTVDSAGRIGFFLAGGAKYALRQTIPDLFHRNGLCYAATRGAIVDRGAIIGRDTVGVIVDRPTVNIDEPFDLEIAEWLMTKPATSAK